MRQPDYQSPCGTVTLYCGDCLEILPTLEAGSVDAVVTDPPYRTTSAAVPIRGRGVTAHIEESVSVGQPWGYSLNWIDACRGVAKGHWVVFANYAMLGGLCTRLDPSAVFVWRKSNAPNMTRPVPRLDCEFIVWSRDSGFGCGRMGEFRSLVLDVPMPQAGCFATERILENGSGKAAHPCQKPVAVVRPFIERIPASLVLDPYMGSGTTGVACIRTGRRFIGIEIDPGYFAIAVKRCQQALDDRAGQLFEPAPVPAADAGEDADLFEEGGAL